MKTLVSIVVTTIGIPGGLIYTVHAIYCAKTEKVDVFDKMTREEQPETRDSYQLFCLKFDTEIEPA